MSWDRGHYPTEAEHEADRMLDEHEERLERADRFAEKGPLPCPAGDQSAADRVAYVPPEG